VEPVTTDASASLTPIYGSSAFGGDVEFGTLAMPQGGYVEGIMTAKNSGSKEHVLINAVTWMDGNVRVGNILDF
jgi:hypothetical protein